MSDDRRRRIGGINNVLIMNISSPTCYNKEEKSDECIKYVFNWCKS